MKTYKPVTDIRVQAVEFIEMTPEISHTIPMRYIIEDDALNKGHYELWVEQDKKWIEIIPGEWVVTDRDHVGFYSCPGAEFKAKYEES